MFKSLSAWTGGIAADRGGVVIAAGVPPPVLTPVVVPDVSYDTLLMLLELDEDSMIIAVRIAYSVNALTR